MSDLGLTPEELQLFFEEAEEQLDIMESTLLALEDEPDSGELIDELFRAAHTLKGGSATVGLNEVAQLTHAMESLLDQVRAGNRNMTSELIDLLLSGVDLLRTGLAAALHSQAPPRAEMARLMTALEAVETDGHHPGGSEVADQYTAAAPAGEIGGDADSFTEDPKFKWRVTVDPDAPMASVRIYQALLIFEGLGEVLSTEPPVEILESDEAEVSDLTLYHASTASPEDVRQALGRISDLETVTYEAVDLPAAAKTAAMVDGSMAEMEGTSQVEAKPADPVEAAEAPVAPAPPRQGAVSAPTVPATDAPVSVERSVRVGVQLLDRLMTLVGELVVDRTRLANLSRNGISQTNLSEELEQLSGHLGRITSDLQDAIMQARMIPVKTLFRKFPRLVRDLSRQLDKQVNFELEGEDTELDRSVIELLSDPLIHLLRNAVDHGLESTEERIAAGKSPTGTIRLSAFHQESHIYVEVSDDGKGLDPDSLRQTVLKRGMMSREQLDRLSYQQLIELIFAPGFSTASSVSTVSGRGVGMDVVRKNLEQVSGSISLRSEPGKGTTFTIQLPLTLAIIQALLVEIAGITFAVPLAHVVEAVYVTAEEVFPAHGWRMIRIRNETVPLLDPGEVWGPEISVPWSEEEGTPVVIVQSDYYQMGVMVDRLIGEEEVVIKSLGPLIGNVTGVSGASILGDGRVALIADIPSLAREVRQSVTK